MAGFKPDEPRGDHGRWTTSGGAGGHMLTPHEHVTLDVAAATRAAHEKVAKVHAQSQLGEAFRPRMTKGEKLYIAGAMANAHYRRYTDKIYKTKLGGLYEHVFVKDRFAKALPPGSKRELAVRAAAAAASLYMTGGLSALSPSFVAGKVWRSADWAYRNWANKQRVKPTTKG